MAGNNTATDEANFWVQSVDQEKELPNFGYVVHSQAYDQECVDPSCAEDCTALWKSKVECANICTDSTCESYVSNLKSTAPSVHNAWAQVDIPNSFNIGRRVVDDTVRNNEINNRNGNSGISTSWLWFDYLIDGREFTAECHDKSCFEFCGSQKWEWYTEYCMNSCVSSFCENIKASRPWGLAWLEMN